jgi:YVTN family beta-propeller protein
MVSFIGRFRLPTVLCLLAAAHAADTSRERVPTQAAAPSYPSPIEMAIAADGSRLYVVCEGTNEVVEIDPAAGTVLRRVRVGQHPKSIALSTDGRFLYVANSWSDSVSVVGVAALKVIKELPAGFEPNAAVADAEGRFLYVANRLSNDISVIDLARGRRTSRSRRTAGASIARTSIPRPGSSAPRPKVK